MAYGSSTNLWARLVSDNNGGQKNNILVEMLKQSEPPKYDGFSKVELAAVRAIHKYDPLTKGHGPNGPLFDDLLDSLNIGRRELHDILDGLNGAGYIRIDPLNSTYSLTDKAKPLVDRPINKSVLH